MWRRLGSPRYKAQARITSIQDVGSDHLDTRRRLGSPRYKAQARITSIQGAGSDHLDTRRRLGSSRYKAQSRITSIQGAGSDHLDTRRRLGSPRYKAQARITSIQGAGSDHLDTRRRLGSPRYKAQARITSIQGAGSDHLDTRRRLGSPRYKAQARITSIQGAGSDHLDTRRRLGSPRYKAQARITSIQGAGSDHLDTRRRLGSPRYKAQARITSIQGAGSDLLDTRRRLGSPRYKAQARITSIQGAGSDHLDTRRRLGSSRYKARENISQTVRCFQGKGNVTPLFVLLQELLMDQSFKLDILFCLCILSDIVRALIYIHKHPLRVHGRLTSEVCMIDSRFSVKVGYYGLPTIYDSVKLLSKTQRKENDNLWIAPELLSCTGRATQKGDVYSLAIIISEILTREEPYSNDKDHMSSQEVLNKIQENFETPFRPTVSAPKEMAIIEHLMRECWSSDPEKRPSLNRVHNIIHGLMMKNNQTGSLVDNLLQRLEKYSSNLERIVDEKVTELKQEKQKSEELLRQMLPASVADRLKAGLLVEPEFYDCVTIYFSDIVGFTDICSMLEPVHIVKMLNDLYSCFDGIIEHFDVYKVETIGDAYMVVSGLPARNGNEHARQIARMSIALLDAVSNFAPLDTPNKDQLKLRIGLNSGPVCAGVVGLKMPRYCLFGDAVNTASRMESNGAEMKIHVSNSTASILQEFGHFVLQSRGTVEIKGKGTMETFWLLSEKDLSSPVTLE
ncbi:atrial natriuretic peptide receptor 1-like isoform X1 [Biomphalaria glabrata]|nr:atrial natriuretic peptide receptor 1-like isoform X1 [Biomphalaria glabrata]